MMTLLTCQASVFCTCLGLNEIYLQSCLENTGKKTNLIFDGIILQAAKFENGGFASRNKQKQKPN